MKHLKLFLTALLFAVSMNTWAEDTIRVSGILYTIVTDSEVVVKNYPCTRTSSVDMFTIRIKSSITYSDKTYKVVGFAPKAFSDVGHIGGLKFPETITEIGDSAFYGNPWSIGQYASSLYNSATYKNYKKLMRLENIKTIGDYAFCDCGRLYYIDLPNVTSIGNYAFYNCKYFYSYNLFPNDTLKFPSTLTTIGDWAFGSNVYANIYRNTAHMIIPSTVTSIGEGAFAGNWRSTIDLSASIDTVKRLAFFQCDTISKIPETVKVIEDTAFAVCTFADATIPSSVKYIGKCAFTSCTMDSIITIPSNVEYIGEYAFKNTYQNCNTKAIYSYIQEPFEIDESVFDEDHYENTTLYVPKGTKTKYENTSAWKKFFKIEEMEDETTDITSVDTKNDDKNKVTEIYNINGTRAKELQRGVNIIKTKGGKTKKVIKR